MEIIFSWQIRHENRTKYGQQFYHGFSSTKTKNGCNFSLCLEANKNQNYISWQLRTKTETNEINGVLSTTNKSRQIDSLTVFGDVM